MNKKNVKNRIDKLKEEKKLSNIETWLKVFPELTEAELKELDGKTIDEFIDDGFLSDIIEKYLEF